MNKLLVLLGVFALTNLLNAQDTTAAKNPEELVVVYSPYADSTEASQALTYRDTIITNEGQLLYCTITEVSTEVIYFKVDSLPGSVCVITTNSVFMLKYANGTRDLGSNLLTPDYYTMGRQDGRKYYKSRDAAIGSFFSGAAAWIGLIGVIPGSIIMATKPKKIHSKDNPNDHLLYTNQDYYDGYMKSARNKKITHSGIAFAGGAAAFIGVILMLIATGF